MSLERSEERRTNSVPFSGLPCPRCKAVVKPRKRFCSQCGFPVGALRADVPGAGPQPAAVRSALCSECGFENHHSDRFCKGCGGILLSRSLPNRSWSGRDVNGVRVTAPTGVDSGGDVEPAGISTGHHDAEARTVLGLAAAGLRSPKARLGTDPPQVSAGATVQTEEFVLPGTTAAGAMPAQDDTHPTPVPDGESSASRASLQGAKSLLHSRGFVFAALGVVVLAPLVLFAARQASSKRSRRLASPAAAPLTALSIPTSAKALLPAPHATIHHGESGSPSPHPSRRKADSGQAEQPPVDSQKANLPAQDPATDAALKPADTLASLDLTPKAVTLDLSVLKPAIPDPPPGPRAARKPPHEAAPLATIANLPPSSLQPAEAKLDAALIAPANAPKFRVGGMVLPAKLLAHPFPAYPADAQSRGVEGTVRLIATVRNDGSVGDLQVASGDPRLVGAALHAVRQWRYQPATLDGKPVQSETRIDIKFHLPD